MRFIRTIKRYLYFWVAAYFGFWARLFLRRWKPTIVAVIGSSGKTTLLHLLESQLGERAIMSHKANSAFGIPFNILGLERKSFNIIEWPIFLILAPFQVFRSIPEEKIYIAEADAERPGEGRFLARLLEPDTVVWLSLEEAHGANYDRLVRERADQDVRHAVKREMAREFGYFLDHAKSLVVLNKDNPFIVGESKRSTASVEWVSEKDVESFKVKPHAVQVVSAGRSYVVSALIPPEAAISVVSAIRVMEHLALPADPAFKGFVLPPGRSSVFKGIKGTVIIDSTYNATIGGMKTMIELMKGYPVPNKGSEKWLVLGDMIEQGRSEKSEHEALAEMIEEARPERIVLVGPRLRETTYAILLDLYSKERLVSFLMPAEALAYLKKEIRGHEVILFKGARFLEGVVERLLADPSDADFLCRRETIWAQRRKEWGV